MPIGISTLCTVGKTFKVIDELLSLNIDMLEILDEWRDSLTKDKIKILNEIRGSSNIKFAIHCPILDLNIASSNPRLRSFAVRFILHSMDKAHAIGAEVYVLHPGLKTPLENLVPRVNRDLNTHSLKKILDYGEKIGLRVAVENMPANTPCFLQRAGEFMELIDSGLPMSLALDVGHANTAAQLESFLSIMNARIVHLHLHDNYGLDDEHRIIGDGTVNWGLIKSKISLDRISAVVENNNINDAKKSFERAVQLFNS
ncbi:MAG: sugar phosphate isomerase/epimerase family protein [Candidatus Methanomethylicaceae archaeon]